jgi:ATP-dependent DNA helicase RecG
MTHEHQGTDKKSLRKVVGSTADWSALASDCVCFANAAGGTLLIGIEDAEALPPADQRIGPELLDQIRKRVAEKTVNVQVAPVLVTAENGGQYIVLQIARSVGVASTSDGRYYVLVGDTCRPVVGDDVLTLLNDRPALPWETLTTLQVKVSDAAPSKLAAVLAQLRTSDRVKPAVKEKSDAEMLAHYGLSDGPLLTNLGALMVGTARDRARLGTAPSVQAIKYDEWGQKVNKWLWDDHTLSPIELVDTLWQGIPDFHESYELPDGLHRQKLPAYDPRVVRELLVNALVHRPYTQRGDILLNLHPDRLEVVNPGRLPLGVTPQTILHASRRRNDRLAALFHDLRLMEKEGTGFDLMYDVQLSQGRPVPVPKEGVDSVCVSVGRRVQRPGVVQLMTDADARFQLRASWLGRLIDLGLVQQTGKTQATRYFVDPGLLKGVGLDNRTTLKRMEPHRLRALVQEDLNLYPGSSSGEVNRRVGSEVPYRSLKRAIDELVDAGKVRFEGQGKGRRYWAAPERGVDAISAKSR